MKKRIISAALATLMAVSAFSTSAFAAGLKSDATLEAAGTVSVPTIDVTVPTSASFIMNPYKMTITKYAAKSWDETGNKPSSDLTSKATLIPFYGPKSDNSAEADGWTIVNNGTTNAVTVSMYATYKAAKTVEVNATTADPAKKQVTLTLKAGTSDVTLLATAPTAWTGEGADGVVTFDLEANNDQGSVANAKKDITLGGGAEAGTIAWTEADTVSISMAFKFDTKANA